MFQRFPRSRIGSKLHQQVLGILALAVLAVTGGWATVLSDTPWLPLAFLTSLMVSAILFARVDVAFMLCVALIPIQFLVPVFGLRGSISDMILLVALGGWMAKALAGAKSANLRLGQIDISLLAMSAFVGVGLLRSIGFLGGISLYSLGKFLGFILLVVFYFAVTMWIQSTEQLRRAIRLWLHVAFLTAILGLVGVVVLRVFGIALFSLKGALVDSTMFDDPNIYASYLFVSIGFGLAMLIVEDSTWRRLVVLVETAVMLVTMPLTGSRSGMLGLTTSMLVFSIVWLRTTRQWGKWVYVSAVITVLSAVTYRWWWPIVNALLQQVNFFRQFTIMDRLSLYQAGVDIFLRNPLQGIGLGSFREGFVIIQRKGGTVIHNTYLWALVEFGILGFFALLCVFVAGLRSTLFVLRSTTADNETKILALATLSGIVGFAVFDLVIDGFYQRHFWALLAIAAALERHLLAETS